MRFLSAITDPAVAARILECARDALPGASSRIGYAVSKTARGLDP